MAAGYEDVYHLWRFFNVSHQLWLLCGILILTVQIQCFKIFFVQLEAYLE